MTVTSVNSSLLVVGSNLTGLAHPLWTWTVPSHIPTELLKEARVRSGLEETVKCHPRPLRASAVHIALCPDPSRATPLVQLSVVSQSCAHFSLPT